MRIFNSFEYILKHKQYLAIIWDKQNLMRAKILWIGTLLLVSSAALRVSKHLSDDKGTLTYKANNPDPAGEETNDAPQDGNNQQSGILEAAVNTVAPTSETLILHAPISVAPTSYTSTSVAPTSYTPPSVAPTSYTPFSVAPTSYTPFSVAPTSYTPTSVAPTSYTPISVAPTQQTLRLITPTSVASTSVALSSPAFVITPPMKNSETVVTIIKVEPVDEKKRVAQQKPSKSSSYPDQRADQQAAPLTVQPLKMDPIIHRQNPVTSLITVNPEPVSRINSSQASSSTSQSSSFSGIEPNVHKPIPHSSAA